MQIRHAFITVIGLIGVTLPVMNAHSQYMPPPSSPQSIALPHHPMITRVFTIEPAEAEQTYTAEDLIANIKNFVTTPKNGTPWEIFGKTQSYDYSYTDEHDMEWSGVRPTFPDDLTALDGQTITVQGYMFPLGAEEKQELFLLGPFPVSCPFHYHVTPNLIIEVHAKSPVSFSYDPVNITGRLELVPKDDEYNVFYRLMDARIAP